MTIKEIQEIQAIWINESIADVQNKLGIKHGDCPPELHMEFENVQKRLAELTHELITINQIKIKIDNIPGYYTIENNELLYCNDNETIQVSDLTELTVHQYNQLSMSIDAAYPEYELKGRFI